MGGLVYVSGGSRPSGIIVKDCGYRILVQSTLEYGWSNEENRNMRAQISRSSNL